MPTGTIGLGILSVSSASRVPKPHAGMPTFKRRISHNNELDDGALVTAEPEAVNEKCRPTDRGDAADASRAQI